VLLLLTKARKVFLGVLTEIELDERRNNDLSLFILGKLVPTLEISASTALYSGNALEEHGLLRGIRSEHRGHYICRRAIKEIYVKLETSIFLYSSLYPS